MKLKLFKLVLFLVIAGFVGVAGFAYFGDLGPTQVQERQPVLLNVD